MIPLSQIVLPDWQPRGYLNLETMQELVESVRHNGIVNPLLVRPLGEEIYELVAGERRYKAATKVGLKEVPAVVRKLTEEQALELNLIENLQRDDLRPIEETEGILELIARKLALSPQMVVVLFHRCSRADREAISSQEWEQVKEVFASLGRFTPESFRTNRLPLLNLPEEVIDAMREGKLQPSKARMIGRVKNPEQRQQLLTQTLEENLTLKEIQSRLDGREEQASEKQAAVALKQRVESAVTLLRKLSAEPAYHEKLRQALVTLEHSLEADSAA